MRWGWWRTPDPAPAIYRLVDYYGPETHWQPRYALLEPAENWALVQRNGGGPLLYTTIGQAVTWARHHHARLLAPPGVRP